MTLFDAYMMVDWSAAAAPRQGKDSIWICLGERRGDEFVLTTLDNPATRHTARDRIAELLTACCERGAKTLAGFDFPFGYPRGFAHALGLTGTPWRAAWDELTRLIADGDDNANNRFDVGAGLNKRLGRPGPFWGCPANRSGAHLPTKKPQAYGKGRLSERRIGERYITGPQPVWKLAYTGSVGSQSLMGLPVVDALCRDKRFVSRIWPFETGLKLLDEPDLRDCDVVLAEIYPSLVKPHSASTTVKDALQAQAMVGYLKALDDGQRLGRLFAGAADLSTQERHTVEDEEAWILGVYQPETRSGRITTDVDNLFDTGVSRHV